MAQNYKIFCENRCITLINPECDEHVINNFDANQHATPNLIRSWLKGGGNSHDYLITCDTSPAVFFKTWFPAMIQVEAAGGVVFNPSNAILFIYRNLHWDLPKGHVDPGETHRETAIREVEEETGLTALQLVSPLPDTWHCYMLKGHWHLKHTCWFDMRYAGTQTPMPQLSEGIERVEWIGPKRIQNVLQQCYRSVQEVLGNLMVNQFLMR